MRIILAALFFFAILTLWVPAWWPVTVFQVGVFALAGVAVLQAPQRPLKLRWPLAPLAFAVLWGTMQWLTGRTAYALKTQTAIVHWATLLAVFLIGYSVLRDASALQWFRSAMVWFAFAVSVQATLQNFTAGGRVFWLFPTGYTDYVLGPIVYHNHYAAFIEAVLPMALYEALRGKRRALLHTAIPAAMYASVIASGSRAGSVLASAEVVAVIAILWLGGRASGRAAGLSLVSLAALCAVFTLVVGPEAVWSRFQIAEEMRPQFAAASLHMISAHPWIGVGLGTWPTVYPRYALADFGVYVNQAHSDWLQWAAEGGVPFVLMIATLFTWSIRAAWRSVWGLGVVAVFLHASVDYPFSRPALGSWVVVIIAMLAALGVAGRQNDSQPPEQIIFAENLNRSSD